MEKINLITVTGPTASGKTAFAAHLAAKIKGEIISADSRQIYKNMDLGTGKDYGDYIVEGSEIPYHLIDIKEAGYKYNVFEFQKDFLKAFEEITARGNMPILSGGTGMYIEAVTKGYKLVQVPVDETLREELEKKETQELIEILKSLFSKFHNTTDTKHRKRTIRAIEIASYYENHEEIDSHFPKINQIVFGIKYNRGNRRNRISQRLADRLKSGMIEEVEQLLKKVSPEDLIFYGLEYKYITLFLTGKLTKTQMHNQLEIAIHQFAKRQMTWFRKMERQGTNIYWIDGELSLGDKIKFAESILNQHKILTN